MESKFYVVRRNDSERLTYYSYFDGRYGRCTQKLDAPHFDKEMAEKIVSQLAALDNREWFVREDAPKPEKKVKNEGDSHDANRAA